MQVQTKRNLRSSVALETGLDEAIEFEIPESSPLHYFFALDADKNATDLVVINEDSIWGETEHQIDFDEAVNSLLQTFDEVPPASLKEKLEDVETLRRLARRFQSVASRLLREAKKRENEFSLSTN